MHNLFLGDLRHHCREVWGINIKDQKTTAKKAVPHTPEEQEKWLGRLLAALRKGALSAVMQPRKGYLVALAQLNGIVPESKMTKHGYGSALLEWVRQHSVDDLRIPPILSKATNEFHLTDNQYDISKFQILTADVIAMLRSDILATFLPSWIERPPANFGSPSHGKLKADHWRTVCTVSMVITLVRVWSLSTATTGERKLLENFIHLVVAVDLATRRSMDAERARLFDHHMLEYLRTLRELFDHDLVPNHHLSLHLASCLLLFGPVRGMWGFPFERYNGIIQHLKTNNHISQIPLTFMRFFYAGAELRWLKSSTEWPDESDELRDVLEAFTQAYQDEARGSRVLDVFGAVSTDPSPCTDDSDLSDRRARLSPHVRYIPKLELARATYGTRSQNIRNSFVYFKLPSSDDPSLLRAGQISHIFLHSRLGTGEQQRIIEPFVVIEEYVALTSEHADHDPYRRFPLLNTRLYYNRFHMSSVIARTTDVVSHFAAFVYNPEGISEPCVVARSLDRVRATLPYAASANL
ncbi:hypothetical protein OH76DRAFT_1459584 [Lentinus brumalis]|uniref:DUF4218 domain-containing protein n=1 Tax=Lentinus brumalis TaxID=2498619 RepID=A0A371CIK5_9APHY|nr:hypothetical protein OH76DRAFT_1459584 [Polyporus brumalis]